MVRVLVVCCIQILNIKLFSMKKDPFEVHRPLPSRKKQLHPAHQPSKREVSPPNHDKIRLQSAQNCQSVLAPRSKKTDAKSSNAKRKCGLKSKKQSPEEMRQLIAEMERQLKSQEFRQNKKEEANLKIHAGKETTQSKGSMNSKGFSQENGGKTKLKMRQSKKMENLSVENVKKFRNILSPSRNKTKVDDSHSSKFLRSTQQTFRREGKSKKTKKSNTQEDTKLYLQAEGQYMLLENNFVAIDANEASFLHEKLLSSRKFLEKRQSDSLSHTKYFNQQKPIDARSSQEIQNYIQDDLSEEQESAYQSVNQIFYENNLEVLQRYIVSKVKIIQRWWRGILNRNHHSLKPIIFDCEASGEFQRHEEISEIQVNMEGSMICTGPPLHEICEPSPIKMMQNFNIEQKVDSEENSSLQMRLQASKTQLETHHQILQKLLAQNKISPEAYEERKSMIEAKYYHQLQEIEEIKKILKDNFHRAFIISQKTNQDIEIADKIDDYADPEILDQIFGKEFCQSESRQISQLSAADTDNNVVNRQKSTGCHFDCQEKVKSSLYCKNTIKQGEYEEDFEQQQEEQNTAQDYYQLQPHNIHNAQTFNTDFKDLFDQYKVREQIKMQIDKRAAVQMGMLIQTFPEQLRNQQLGIDTSLTNIHKFLLSFFKFYIFNYKDEFLRLVNMPYGHNIDKRLKILQGFQEKQFIPQEDEEGIIYGLESVISADILDEFYQKMYEFTNSSLNTVQRANVEFDKIHNRALFDGFNEALNQFRPYFMINGPPYPWNNSQKALTFYFIAEDNIQQVFEKSQFKVLKWASTLCGIFVKKYSNIGPIIHQPQTVEQIIENYRSSAHPMITQTREERLTKNQKIELIEGNHHWAFTDQDKTAVILDTFEFVYSELIRELADDFFFMHYEGTTKTEMSTQKSLSHGVEYFQNLTENSSDEQIEIF